MAAQKLTTSPATDNSLSPSLKWYGESSFCLKFRGSCLKQKNAANTSTNKKNMFIVYELDLNTDFNLGGFSFGGVK